MAKAKKRGAGSWTYVLYADRELPDEQQSRFILRPLTGAERDYVTDNSWRIVTMPNGSIERVSRMRTVARELVLTNLQSVERFPIDQPVAWPATRAEREKYLDDHLDDEDVFEIGNQIYERSSLGPEEAKQVGESSAPAPTSS
jgi:hypothetical protein